MAETCIFCDIAAKKASAEIVYEDDQVVVFPDIRPSTPIHLLVIPKEHHPDLDTLVDGDLLQHMVGVAKQVGAQQSPKHGYRLQINSEKQAEVGHVHMHILGGFPREEAGKTQGGDSKE